MRQTTQQQVQQVGSDFIRRWYERIDAKAPFETIAGDTVGAELVVDFPNNPLDFDGFRRWYEGQCSNYTGCHHIHRTETAEEQGLLVIRASITWRAESRDREEIVLYPDVTLRLRWEDGWRVCYYGCQDRAGEA